MVISISYNSQTGRALSILLRPVLIYCWVSNYPKTCWFKTISTCYLIVSVSQELRVVSVADSGPASLKRLQTEPKGWSRVVAALPSLLTWQLLDCLSDFMA